MDITFVTFPPSFQSSPVPNIVASDALVLATVAWFNIPISKVSFAISKTSTDWPLFLYQREKLLKIEKNKPVNCTKKGRYMLQLRENFKGLPPQTFRLRQCRVVISHQEKAGRCNFSGSTALDTPYVLLEEFPVFNLSMNRQCNALLCNQN